MDNLAAYGIPALVQAAANGFGDKTCAIAPERSVSFRQFAADVAAIAGHLESLGIAPGDRVAILDVNSLNFLETLCALGVLGAIAVPLNYRQRVPEYRFQIEDSGARLLLANSRYAAEAEELASSLALGWRAIDDGSQIGLPGTATAGRICLTDPEPATPLAICYTSGTTGRPKGAVIDQFTANLRAFKLMYDLRLGPDDVMHMTTPMFHISCLMLSLAALQRGATQLILPQFDYEATMAAVREHKVTFINTVPTILSMALARDDFTPDVLAGLRLIMYTAAPMSLPLLRKLMSVYKGGLVQFLGQTEDLPQTVLTPEDHRNALAGIAVGRLESIGLPSAGVDLRISDDAGEPVPRGQIGEIVTRGGTAMSGYWNLPEETTATLRDGWIHTGDLGRQDADGYVYLAGRKKHMIIRGGENVYPSEVEPVLLEAPGVRDAVILGLPDETWGEIVVAAVTVEGNNAEAEAIIAHCKHHLASYRCPVRIFFVDEMPLNAAGKVLRHVLLDKIAGRR
ncbi:MAG: AMP-binding protein [Alphaproteobacteria bacterium]|nr:AMP-binding protein [Alphaproteobacteria bacterium]MDP6814636.1 AMP-binding protein [Alphaproteobacteria bacterium]